MEKQKKSYGTIALVVLLLVVTVVSLVLATYAWAKYTTAITPQTASAQVAKWDVRVTPNGDNFVKTYTYVAPTRIAPGTSGKYDLNIASTNTEVAFDYTITMTNIKNKPTNLVFYTSYNQSTGEYSNPITLTETGTDTGIYNGSSSVFTGHVDVDSTSHKATTNTTVTIYWNWPYETPAVDGGNTVAQNDALDTQDGENAELMSFDVTLTATQTRPVAQ